MHIVGARQVSSFANKAKHDTVLRADKTTFEANFLKNPSFAGTDKVVNKNRYADGIYRKPEPKKDNDELEEPPKRQRTE